MCFEQYTYRRWLTGSDDGQKIDVDSFDFAELWFSRYEFVFLLNSFCYKERERSDFQDDADESDDSIFGFLH